MTRRRVALAGLVGLALVGALMACVLLGAFPQSWAKRWLEAEVGRRAGGRLVMDELVLVPGALSLEARGVVLTTPSLSFRASRLRVVGSWASLPGRRLVLKSLELQAPELKLGRQEKTTGGAVAPPPFVVENIELTGGRASLAEPAAALEGIEAHGGIGTGVLTIDVASGTVGGVALRPSRARLRVSPLLALQVEAFEGGTLRSSASARGSLGSLLRPSPDLQLEGRLDLADGRAFGLPEPSSGIVAVAGRFRGGELEAQGDSASLVVSGVSLPQAHLEIQGRPDAAKGSFTMRVLGGEVSGQGTWKQGLIEATARATGLQLPAVAAGRASGDLKVQGDPRGRISLEGGWSAEVAPAPGTRLVSTGRVRGTVTRGVLDLAWEASGQGEDPGHHASLTSLALQGTAVGPFPPVVDGHGEGHLAVALLGPEDVPFEGHVHLEGAGVAATVDAHGLGGSLHAEVNPEGTLNANLQGLDLARLAREAKGTADVSAHGSLRMAEGRLDLRGGSWHGVEVGDAQLSVHGSPAEGTFEGEAAALGAKIRGTWNPHRVIGGQLVLLSTVVPPTQGVSGVVSGTLDFEAPLSDLEKTTAHLTLDRLSLSRGNLNAQNEGPIVLAAQGTNLEVQKAVLKAEGLSLDLSGRASPAQLGLRLAAQVDARVLPLGGGASATGIVRLNATLTGPTRAPMAEGSLEGEVLELSLAGKALLSLPKGRIDFHGGDAVLTDLRVAAGGGEVTLTGTVPWSEALPGALVQGATHRSGTVVVQWSGVRASALGVPALDGVLAGELRLNGSPAAPREVEGSLSLPETPLRYGDLDATLGAVQATLVRGRVKTESATMRAPGWSIEARGDADLVSGNVSSVAKGSLDLRLLSPFLPSAALGGRAKVDLVVDGSLKEPRPHGTLEVTNGTIRTRVFSQAVTGLQATLVLAGDRVEVQSASGELGGGPLRLTGSAGLSGKGVSNIDLRITGEELGLRFPEGLRSRVSADLTLTGDPGRLLLKGQVKADRGLYDLDLVLREGITTRAPVVEESSALRSIALDLQVGTANPIRVRNNVASLETQGSLTIRGDAQDPAPFGRFELVQGGSVFLQGQEFRITTGGLTFNGTFDPTVQVQVQRTIRDANSALGKTNQEYLVTVGVEGSLYSPRLNLSADPAELSENQILGLITSGESAGSAKASWVAGAQAASLLAGNVGGSVSKGLAAFGLGDISVRPELIARETDPGARFTFGKDITKNVTLIYSLDLNDTSGRFVQLQARPGAGITLMGQRSDDGTVTAGAGQNVRLGGYRPKVTKSWEEGFRLSEVRFEGRTPVDADTLAKEVKAKAGKSTNIWKLQEDADRLRQFLVDKGYIEAEVSVQEKDRVAVFQIHAGHHFVARVEGMRDPPDLGPVLRKALFEDEALETGRARLLRILRGRGDLRATVVTQGLDEAGDRVLLFTVSPGQEVPLKEVQFVGARALSRKALLEAAGGPGGLIAQPVDAVGAIVKAYVANGYLEAKVQPPEVLEEPGGVVVKAAIDEGPLARIGAVRFTGSSWTREKLMTLAGVKPGVPALDAPLTAAAARIRSQYLDQGYTQVRVAPSLVPAGPNLDAEFTIDEGPRILVGPIEIKGLTKTLPGLVRRQVSIRTGDPLDLRKLGALERRLLDLGVFDRVVVTASDDNPATVTIDLREGPWAVAGYDFRWDDVQHGTVLVDAELRNLFGTGIALGGRYRVGSSVEDVRGSLHASSVGVVGDVTFAVFRVRQDFAAVDFFTQEPITNVQVQKGYQIFTTKRFARTWTLQWGYQHSTVESTLEPTPIGLGGLNGSVYNETRDNILDPTRGRFLSLSIDYDPTWLGSDLQFTKGLAQVFLIKSLSSSWVWAQGGRLGLGQGLGGAAASVDTSGPLEASSSGNFLAGGADSLRGYATNSLGPVDFLGNPVGGDAVVIVNEELRFRHSSGLGAAFFYDGGNVFATISQMSFKWKHDLGLGLRYISPVGLLRLDFGFPLNPSPGDKAMRIFFSIGQIF
jgi:outer membrane protein assembly factor BamA